MASGVPTVAFDYGATREHLRDGSHGAAIALGDENGFIAATRHIGSDADLPSVMGTAARAAVARLRPADVEATFDDILAGPATSHAPARPAPPYPPPGPSKAPR